MVFGFLLAISIPILTTLAGGLYHKEQMDSLARNLKYETSVWNLCSSGEYLKDASNTKHELVGVCKARSDLMKSISKVDNGPRDPIISCYKKKETRQRFNGFVDWRFGNGGGEKVRKEILGKLDNLCECFEFYTDKKYF